MKYKDTWSKAKKAFKKTTKKSKPGSASGIEKIAGSLDKLMKKPTFKAFSAAKEETAFTVAKNTYQSVLNVEKRQSSDKAYKAAIDTLSSVLDDILNDFITEKNKLLVEIGEYKFIDSIGKTAYGRLAKSKIPTNPLLVSFSSDSKFGESADTGLPEAALTSLQKKAATALEVLKSAQKLLISKKDLMMTRKAALQTAYQIYEDAGAAIGPMEGLQGFFAEWTQKQSEILKKAGKNGGNWIKNGPLKKEIVGIGATLTTAAVTMADSSSDIDDELRRNNWPLR